MDVRPSPFPGMDPYLCPRWSDIGLSLLMGITSGLNKGRLPDRLIARTNCVEIWLGEREPPRRDRWAYVFDHHDHDRVVTHIELLRPDNRVPGPTHDAYIARLKAAKSAGIHIVEIDLHRGPRAATPRQIPADEVNVAGLIATCRAPGDVWQTKIVPLRSAVPPVSIPLRATDDDLTIDLQSLLDHAYFSGRHDDIKYVREPKPPLSPDDAVWADALLKAAGRRPA